MFIAAVKFSEISMPKFYAVDALDLKNGDYCICPVENREETGFIASLCPHNYPDEAPPPIYPKIIRKATAEEIEKWKLLKIRERKTIAICRQKALDHNLIIKVTDVRFDDANNKIIFHFTADKRVDFRDLVRDLAGTLHSRIELWQIGVRDEARQIDGLGICGQRLCCAAFLKDFKPVTIRLAKNQDIFLSPNKLSGCCGRLMCCLSYEEDFYRELSQNAPPIGAMVRTQNNIQGVVIERNLLMETYIIQDAEENKYTTNQSQIVDFQPPEKPVTGMNDEESEEGEISEDENIPAQGQEPESHS